MIDPIELQVLNARTENRNAYNVNWMSDLERLFEQATVGTKQLPEKPDNDTLLELNAFYKQGTSGDVSGEKPGFFDFGGVAKFEAREKIQGMEIDEAKQKYVDLVTKLQA